MYNFLFKLSILILLALNLNASKTEVLDNNISTNLEQLSNQLKYLLPNYKESSNDISNLLNIYYQHYEKIQAFEIVFNNKTIYSSYKNDSNIFILKDESLPIEIKKTPEIYEKNILDGDKSLGKLIVYFKNEIDFTQEELDYLKNKKILKIQNDSNLTPYNFKNINDTYGHTTGDVILKEFAQVLSKNIRETDFIGRWGGEEFLIILPKAKENKALITAENLRVAVEKFNFYHNIKITASFGVYECKESNPTKCISKADKALYKAKNSNRNCVKSYSEI